MQATANWLNGASGDYFFQGDNVLFNDSASQFNVNVVGTPAPATVTVSNNINSLHAFIHRQRINWRRFSHQTRGRREFDPDHCQRLFTPAAVRSSAPETVSAGNNSAFSTGVNHASATATPARTR